MKGPQFLVYIRPLIEVLKNNGGSGTTSDIIDQVIETMDIPDKEVAKTISSGASRVRNRIQWARMYLVKSDLMDSSQRGIWKLTEKGFEKICKRLLTEVGIHDVQVTGQTGDQGIDGTGVIKINDVVGFNVIFQCKKYKNAVAPRHVRDFRGTMQGRADKGIIITTGRFTKEAKREAVRDGVPPIELIDGEKLISLFEKYKLGLKPKVVYDVLPDFFENYK